MLEAAYRADPQQSLGPLGKTLGRWLRRARSNTLAGSRANIHHHYDIGDDFYRLWLDEQMLYTCAYFPTPAATLEEAQRAKMDYVCRKVWLRPGETVVEAGCGWGALALHMARHYGVTVKAYNVSHEQIHHARRRARAEGPRRPRRVHRGRLPQHSRAVRRLRFRGHVGARRARALRRSSPHGGPRCLGPAGRGLIHSIGRDRPGGSTPGSSGGSFPGPIRRVSAR